MDLTLNESTVRDLIQQLTKIGSAGIVYDDSYNQFAGLVIDQKSVKLLSGVEMAMATTPLKISFPKNLTVKELVDILRRTPQDLTIFCWGKPVTLISVDDEGDVRVSRLPKAPPKPMPVTLTNIPVTRIPAV